jgi:Protein of unknown function (DUF3306)
MSEPGAFLLRWSHRKQKAAGKGNDAEATPQTIKPERATVGETPRELQEGKKPPATRSEPSKSIEPTFDITRLPPIESITADTDIRPFLGPGVPPEVTRSALHRAWLADPKIRDFVGPLDYGWDFNNPDSIPGFGSLEIADEVRRQVVSAMMQSVGPGAPSEPANSACPQSANENCTAMPELPAAPPHGAGETASDVAMPGAPNMGASSDPSATTERDPAAQKRSDVPPPVQPLHGAPAQAFDPVAEQPERRHTSQQPFTRRTHGGALPHLK